MKTNKDRCEVILAGSGGQGLVVSGIMLAEAAILEGKNVVQTVSYGIATRGGFSMAEVIIDKEEIIFQQVQKADIVLTLTEEAMEKFQSFADSGTSIIYDSTLLEERRGSNICGYPFTDMAGKLGHVGMANIIALGFMAQKAKMIGTDSLEKVIQERFSGNVMEMNLKALQAGVNLAL
ncbi:MAG: Pyruvate synthase subunit PorC [Smithella sp. PtaU1.Bin162]|jgi:2-oxoglutarate ferredoxin oxidoreductase subunit gamma|nr:MAG: Pyruvate synthase subunit PorC [Smithella sp. PtaU1.Bin162]